MQIVQAQDTDWHRAIKHFGLDVNVLAKDITIALDRLPRGSTSISDLAENISDAVERGWVYGTLKFGESQVRTGHLLFGMLKTRSLANRLLSISKEFDKIKPDVLGDEFAMITAGSPEENLRASDGSGFGGEPGEASGAIAPAAMGKQEARKKFSVDLTERARKGEIDPVTGRDAEIRQIVDILMRRRQNNPILVGEAGVGKTAVVEGFALRIAQRRRAAAAARTSRCARSIIGLLQAGAAVKGEFEHRLRSVIDEVQAQPTPIILFIDEAHTMIGAGGQAGPGDAANLLKPALARGNCARSPPPRGPSTRSTSRRTRRSRAASSWSRWKSRASQGDRRCCAASPLWRNTTACRCSMKRSPRRRELSHSLHPRPAVARQGGQRARHAACARGARPARDAARRSGGPSPHRGAGAESRSSSAKSVGWRWQPAVAAPTTTRGSSWRDWRALQARWTGARPGRIESSMYAAGSEGGQPVMPLTTGYAAGRSGRRSAGEAG